MGEPETSPGGRRRDEEARMGFKLDLREIGWAPYVMIGGGLGLGIFVLAIATLRWRELQRGVRGRKNPPAGLRSGHG